jgi:hypothetical protein
MNCLSFVFKKKKTEAVFWLIVLFLRYELILNKGEQVWINCFCNSKIVRFGILKFIIFNKIILMLVKVLEAQYLE